MSEFHDAVSTLLDAFARALSIIKSHKKENTKEQASAKADHRTQLRKSLERNSRDVKNAYGRDLAQFGPDFAAGDAEARSSLSRILSRLSTGLLSIFERFTKGRSTSSDYQALLSLSDRTRNETIHTFDQLSKRLSHSSLSLNTAKKPHQHRADHRSKGKKIPKRVRSAPDLSLTPLGLASAAGWVRPKLSGRRPSQPKSLSSACSKRKEKRPAKPPHQVKHLSTPALISHNPTLSIKETRTSIMSFASDSTKLGEIPEHKWTRTPILYESGGTSFPVTTFYPLERYEEPVKQRSRFMRLFGR